MMSPRTAAAADFSPIDNEPAQTAIVNPQVRARFDAARAGVLRPWDASVPWLLAIGVAIAGSNEPHPCR